MIEQQASDLCSLEETAFPDTRKESHHDYSHRKSIELANKLADPIYQRQAWHYHYWHVMAGFGFRPYISGY